MPENSCAVLSARESPDRPICIRQLIPTNSRPRCTRPGRAYRIPRSHTLTMIAKPLEVPLPPPWANQAFATNQIGTINYLVGPNGTGKSRFAKQLVNHLPNARILGSDRLSGMEEVRPFSNFTGDPLADGLAKREFSYFKQEGIQGYGMDAFVLLEERLDLRIQVEATLSHLFDREIILEWDSGNLIAKARRVGDTAAYRLDREECHGIKELLVLLTHLYDMNNQHLIIDEPELNLHPQFQAFFMQEVRKVAGDLDVNPGKKIVFLITHSPFMLDLQSEDDVNSIISFDLQESVPRQVSSRSSQFAITKWIRKATGTLTTRSSSFPTTQYLLRVFMMLGWSRR